MDLICETEAGLAVPATCLIAESGLLIFELAGDDKNVPDTFNFPFLCSRLEFSRFI